MPGDIAGYLCQMVHLVHRKMKLNFYNTIMQVIYFVIVLYWLRKECFDRSILTNGGI